MSEKVKIIQIALCEWCHKRHAVDSPKEADHWLRTHDCPEKIK